MITELKERVHTCPVVYNLHRVIKLGIDENEAIQRALLMLLEIRDDVVKERIEKAMTETSPSYNEGELNEFIDKCSGSFKDVDIRKLRTGE